MRKLRWIVLVLAALLVVTLVAGWVLQPRGAICEIGPSKTKIRWVSWEEARAKPRIDIALPWGGRFLYPKPYLPFRRSDPRVVAGYLLVQAPEVWAAFGEDLSTSSSKYAYEYPGFPDAVVPVLYADSAARTSSNLRVVLKRSDWGMPDMEEVKIRRPFDPSRLPAQFKESKFAVGPFKFFARMASADEQVITFEATASGPTYKHASFQSQVNGLSRGGTITTTERFEFDGLLLKSGEVLVQGQLITRFINDSKSTLPISVTLKPKVN